MTEETRKLATKYYELELVIKEKLSKLKNDGMPCDCDTDEREKIKFIHEGNFEAEMLSFCLDCGGYIEE